MAQTAIDADVADFLDDSPWTAAVVVNATSTLNGWCRWLADRHVAVVDAERRDLRDYLAARSEAGIAPATRKKAWQFIRAFYAWAARPPRDGGAGLLDDDPMVRVRAPHVPARPTTRAARRGEVERLEDYFAALARHRRAGGETERARRNLAIVSLMFRSGLRSGEIPHIDVADLHTRRDGHLAITLRPRDRTKNRDGRLVPVLPETERYLRRYLRLRGQAAGPLFLGRPGHTAARDGRLSAHAVQQLVDRAAARCGLAVSAHQLRRGFTAEYLRAGGDVLSLEIIGGWADHRMPRRYLADEEADAALDRFYAVTDRGPARRAVGDG